MMKFHRQNRFVLSLALTLAGAVLSGCSTMTMTVNSVPEKAKVFVRPVGGGEGVQVGTTPIVLHRDHLKGADSASGPIFVEVQKDGFQTERVLVTESAAVDMKLNFALQLKDPDQGMKAAGTTLDDAQSLNTAIDRLFEVRKFISLESYSEALNHLRYIEQSWPYLSATYEMKAGIFFLQRKYRDALAAYALALKYNPKSVSSADMRDSLEKQLGIKGDDLVREYEVKRLPAGAKGGAAPIPSSAPTGARAPIDNFLDPQPANTQAAPTKPAAPSKTNPKPAPKSTVPQKGG